MRRCPIAEPSTCRVTAELAFDVSGPITLALQVAVAAQRPDEHISVTLGGGPVDVAERRDGGSRLHVLRITRPGPLVATYEADVRLVTGVEGPGPATRSSPDDAEVLLALRPSRYCPSDALRGFAWRELAGARAHDVAAWVHRRLQYDVYATHPLHTAVDTLAGGAGVCRDFAHLTIALCRGIGIPARLVSAYAPGLSPMDFHAVVEAWEDGRWLVHDPTRLAPRRSLVRIATGRDAADTAFADVVQGDATFRQVVVTATADVLPFDEHAQDVAMARLS